MTGRHPVSVITAFLVEQILSCILDIVSQILGDVLLATYDPRISLSEEGGGGR